MLHLLALGIVCRLYVDFLLLARLSVQVCSLQYVTPYLHTLEERDVPASVSLMFQASIFVGRVYQLDLFCNYSLDGVSLLHTGHSQTAVVPSFHWLLVILVWSCMLMYIRFSIYWRRILFVCCHGLFCSCNINCVRNFCFTAITDLIVFVLALHSLYQFLI